eukprot:TRINITY_DN3810_c0_g1_i14.p1 TRINITY_DN3810_c0_g1~~TRINITY_DN3810_c0_g1_i14.p1  ORF type:complete len:269 (-),score=-12.33 TRINITY_DN3810_c0_g1_i14:1934-2740(-)
MYKLYNLLLLQIYFSRFSMQKFTHLWLRKTFQKQILIYRGIQLLFKKVYFRCRKRSFYSFQVACVYQRENKYKRGLSWLKALLVVGRKIMGSLRGEIRNESFIVNRKIQQAILHYKIYFSIHHSEKYLVPLDYQFQILQFCSFDIISVLVFGSQLQSTIFTEGLEKLNLLSLSNSIEVLRQRSGRTPKHCLDIYDIFSLWIFDLYIALQYKMNVDLCLKFVKYNNRFVQHHVMQNECIFQYQVSDDNFFEVQTELQRRISFRSLEELS